MTSSLCLSYINHVKCELINSLYNYDATIPIIFSQEGALNKARVAFDLQKH